MYIFVYGSLKRGFYNYPLLDSINAQFIQIAYTTPKFDLLNLGVFPGMVPGNFQIEGEIYKVNQSGLDKVDRLEGHPHFYKRTDITDDLLDITISPVYTYIYQHIRKNCKYVPEKIAAGAFKTWRKNLDR